MLVNIEI